MEFEFQYELVSNLAVKSGKARLRTCNAIPALNWALNKKIQPEEFWERAKPLYAALKKRVDNAPEGLISFEFNDESRVVWISRLKMWTIKYPFKADLIYIPSSVNEEVDRLDNTGTEYNLWNRIK